METRLCRTLTFVLALGLLGGCKTPTVSLSTAEPIKVDINMRLDVYQCAASTQKGSATVAAPEDAAQSRHRNRLADIQNFKNDRIVGEGHDGLVVVCNPPANGDYATYVNKVVTAENADRMQLMNAIADKDKVPLPEVQKQQAEIWRNRSFKGELIESPQPDGTWVWGPKVGGSTSP